MMFYVMTVIRGMRRCPDCAAFWCPVYGALGNTLPRLPSIYLMHRGFQR